MKKLLNHLRLMQGQAARYIEPTPDYAYFVSDSGDWPEGVTPTREQRTIAFANDMIYFLDGPQQREAEAEASFDYLAESARTAAGHYHAELVNFADFGSALANFIEAARGLDRYKKLMFYGEDVLKGRVADVRDDHQTPHGERIIDHIEAFDIDGPWVDRQQAEFILHAILGIASESGELAEWLVDVVYDGKDPDRANALEEVGDLQWYEAMLARVFSTDFDAIQRTNIDKLRARFPEKFTTELANNRNLAVERVILETGSLSTKLPYEPPVIKRLDDTFDPEQVQAAADLALAKAEADAVRVSTQAVDFPDEMKSGVDPMSGKQSDEK